MRCKVGDIAVVVSVDEPQLGRNIGALVKVVAHAEAGRWWVEALQPVLVWKGGPRQIQPGDLASALDGRLRPLRDREGKDETLFWAKPGAYRVNPNSTWSFNSQAGWKRDA